MVLGLSCLSCCASHSSQMLCRKAAIASASGQSTIWFFLVKKQFQKLPSGLARLLDDVDEVIGIWGPNIGALEVSPEGIFELFLASDRVLRQAIEPMPCRSFKFQR